jgi:hypothetical protein
MPIIKIDKYTTLPAPVELHESKYYWELFPYDAEIDMVDWTYGGQPMSEDQITFIEAYRIQLEDVLDYDEDLSKRIITRIEEQLINYDILIDREYKDLLGRMAMVMSASEPNYGPMIITARPGLGKTQMLKASLIEKINSERGYSAIIVTRRVQDALSLSDEINVAVGRSECWVRPSITLMTLDGQKCANGHTAKDKDSPTICRKENCAHRECPVKTWRKDIESKAIVFITSKFLQHLMDDDSLAELMETAEWDMDTLLETDQELFYYFDADRRAVKRGVAYTYRDELIIDENPGMIFSPIINNRMLNDCLSHLKSRGFLDKFIKEYKSMMLSVSGEMAGATKYEYTENHIEFPKLSRLFIKAWKDDPHPENINMPRILNNFVENGGIRQSGNQMIDYAIGISSYRDMKDLPFRTVIYDGSGLKDLTYKPSDFSILDVPEIRDFSRATIHVYPKNLSKAFYAGETKKKKIASIAKEAIRVLGGQPSLFITYKELTPKFKALFEKHQNIRVNHYGNLIGKNKYQDCKAVFFAGTNDWGTFAYFTQASAISNEKLNLSTVQHKGIRFEDPHVRRFYYTLVAVGMYQDLMRSNLRVFSGTEPVEIHVWTAANEVVNQLVEWLPGVNTPIYEDVPSTLFDKRQPSEISTSVRIKLDEFKVALTNEDLNRTMKPKTIKLTKFLFEHLTRDDNIPLQVEYEYVYGPIKDGHYHRVKKFARNWIESQKES